MEKYKSVCTHRDTQYLQVAVAVFPCPAKPYESVLFTMIGWYLSQENDRVPEDAKHAFCAPAAAAPLVLLQDCTGPRAPAKEERTIVT